MHVVRPKKPALAQPIARFAVPVDENAFVDWLIDAGPGEKPASSTAAILRMTAWRARRRLTGNRASPCRRSPTG